MNCKNCKFCKQIGRQKSQRHQLGRKTYYCDNPEIYKLEDKKGRPVHNFIGFGDMTKEGPLQLKTHKRWCPLQEKTKWKSKL